MTKIDCFKCIYFFITYDANFPYGCKLMGFKSKKLPCKEVFTTSGEECKGFQEKTVNP
ncbi:MAG TPA: uracil-DNA glycosylase [Nitrospirae bacterium]|nr:uracil-DNA glycosylase [Nitrospirota bacterium]